MKLAQFELLHLYIRGVHSSQFGANLKSIWPLILILISPALFGTAERTLN